MSNPRDYELVVWGATGFTGKLVAEHLGERIGFGGELRWALGGRNLAKLESVRRSLGPAATELPLIVADAHDEADMRRLAASTRVVCTTVGPFARYGSALVAACAQQGTHYCDLAGEVPWMRSMIDQHAEAARGSGAVILHACGFDSLPSELGVELLQTKAIERHGLPCEEIQFRVMASRGKPSGGTIASMIHTLDAIRSDPNLVQQLQNGELLCPEGSWLGPQLRDRNSAGYDRRFGQWRTPFIMAPINTRIVRWSHALRRPGTSLHYEEAALTGSGFKGAFMAHSFALGLPLLTLACYFRPSRALLQRWLLPAPGEGPNEHERHAGFFDIELRGRPPGQAGDMGDLRIRVTGERDPGYGATSRMIGEVALCLTKLASDPSPRGGIWPPGYVLHKPLLAQLEAHAGMRFKLLD